MSCEQIIRCEENTRLWRGLVGWGVCIRSFEAGTEVKVGRGLGYEEEKGRCAR